MAGADWDPVSAMGALSLKTTETKHKGINFPVETSVSFSSDPEELAKLFVGDLGPQEDAWLYSREYNPSVVHLSKLLAALEGTESAYCFSSGMAAISSVILQLCSNGDHIVASNTIYSGTYGLLTELMPRVTGVQVTLVDIRDLAAVEGALQGAQGRARVLYFEAVSNPALVVADIPALCALAHRHGASAVVDNTFTPCTLSPTKHGADVVVHSLTKFLNGGGDAIAGVACASHAFVRALADVHSGAANILGGTMAAATAALIASRLPHVGLRVGAHSARALEFARRLRALNVKVVYPGLEEHPDHALMTRLMNGTTSDHDSTSSSCYGYGGLMAVDVCTREAAFALIRALDARGFAHSAVSLGFHDTLMCCSGSSTASIIKESEREAAGISPGYIRMSIGFTGSLEEHWAILHGTLVELKIVGAHE